MDGSRGSKGDGNNIISVDYFVVRHRELDDRVLGTFGIYTMLWSPTAFWLGWFAIHSDWNNQGLGTICLKVAEKIAKGRGATVFCIETSPHHHKAVEFYKKRGFVQSGYIENYYHFNEPLMIMSKKIDR